MLEKLIDALLGRDIKKSSSKKTSAKKPAVKKTSAKKPAVKKKLVAKKK